MRKILLLGLLLVSICPNAFAEQVHKVSVRTLSGVKAGIEKWQATFDHLSQRIPGHRFEMVPYPRLDTQLKDAQHKRFDFLLTNPATYVEIKNQTGAQALVTLVNRRHNKPQTRFGSVIFVRADRDDIVSLRDLKGKHLKAVSPLAFGGWTMVWREMRQNHFDPETDLGQLSFANGNQAAVVKAVQQGEADAGVVRTDMLERLEDKGMINLVEFRILHNRETEGFPFFHSTPLYPEWPFAAMPNVSDALRQQVKAALLQIRQDDPAALRGKYIGWTEALDYQSVEELLQELNIGSYTKTPDGKFNFHYLYPIGFLLLLLIIFLALGRPVSNNR